MSQVGGFGTATRLINVKVGDFVSFNDFADTGGNFASATATPATNDVAFAAAMVYCGQYNCGLYCPDPHYNVDKLVVNSNFTGTFAIDPIRIWSDCSQTPGTAWATPGCRFICHGGGASWLPGVINIVTPNSGNTGPNTTTNETYGAQLEGIYADVASGVTGLIGIWGVRQWKFSFINCGVADNSAAAWAAGIQLDTGVIGLIDRCNVSYCSTGIALGGPTSTGPTAQVRVRDTNIKQCTSAGVGFAYTTDSFLEGCSIQSSAVGAYNSGQRNQIFNNNFGSGGATNTVDYDCVTSTPGGGGVPSWVTSTFKPDGTALQANTFNSPVNVRNSAGTMILPNTSNSTLLIDSSCTGTYVFPQSKLFSSFTDSAADTTWMYDVTSATAGSPITGAFQGGRGQRYTDTSTTPATAYICTVSGSPHGTWKAVGSAASGVTSLSPGTLTGAVTIAGVNNTVTQSGSTITITNAGVTSVNAGAGINLSGATGAVTISASAAPTSTWSPSITFLGGSASISSSSFGYEANGKHYDLYIVFNFTVSSGSITGFQFNLPFTPANGGGGSMAWGNGSVGMSNFLTWQAGSTTVTVQLNAGATAGSGSYGLTYSGPARST